MAVRWVGTKGEKMVERSAFSMVAWTVALMDSLRVDERVVPWVQSLESIVVVVKAALMDPRWVDMSVARKVT